MLAGLWEQLEAAHAEVSTATRQQNLANNSATVAEAERDRTHTVSAMQDRVDRDLHQQLAQAQHVVMDLQHEVHYLNNQLHPILEEEDPYMVVEDDGWYEEEVEPENEDDPIFDLNSDHNEDYNRLVTS